MDTLALLKSLIVELVIEYLITYCRLENYSGRLLTIFSIKGKASMAEPSTTSIINNPFT
jgi:hypothetical protein